LLFLPGLDKFGQLAETIQMVSALMWVKCPQLPDGTDDPEKPYARSDSSVDLAFKLGLFYSLPLLGRLCGTAIILLAFALACFVSRFNATSSVSFRI
jgi:hypothetical protein